MSNQQQYDIVHKLAKFLICSLVVILLVLSRFFPSLMLDIISVPIWFFGVNPTAWLLEEIKGFGHKHNIF